mgnify:CR=1 FL=1
MSKIRNIFNCEKNPELKNIKQQIIENQIEAKYYSTDEGEFVFEEIRIEFEEYLEKIITIPFDLPAIPLVDF